MRRSALLAAVAISPLLASASFAQQAEVDYPKGSLAYQAIVSKDFAAAEQRLRDESRIPRDDPARLINHGYVLAQMGRLAEAAKLFEKAARADAVELVLADGRTMTSRRAARLALRSVSVGDPEPE